MTYRTHFRLVPQKAETVMVVREEYGAILVDSSNHRRLISQIPRSSMARGEWLACARLVGIHVSYPPYLTTKTILE